MNKNVLLVGLLCCAVATGALAADKPEKIKAQTSLGLYVTAQEAWTKLQADDSAILVDVRDPVEIKFTGFASSTHIHVPWMLADINGWSDKQSSWSMVKNPAFSSQVLDKLDKAGATLDTTIIVMCRSGSSRSAPAVNLLAAKGYKQVWTVVDGFEGSTLKEGDSKGVRAANGWRNAGLPWSYKIDPAVAWQAAK